MLMYRWEFELLTPLDRLVPEDREQTLERVRMPPSVPLSDARTDQFILVLQYLVWNTLPNTSRVVLGVWNNPTMSHVICLQVTTKLQSIGNNVSIVVVPRSLRTSVSALSPTKAIKRPLFCLLCELQDDRDKLLRDCCCKLLSRTLKA